MFYTYSGFGGREIGRSISGIPAYGWALIGVVAFLDASGRRRPKVLKYRLAFNISRIMSEGVALFSG